MEAGGETRVAVVHVHEGADCSACEFCAFGGMVGGDGGRGWWEGMGLKYMKW